MTTWDPRALAVLDRLEQAGYQAVLVGGCVRDMLRGESPHDYDGATAARPEEMLSVFAGWHVVQTGLKHGTLTIFSDGLPVEMTTFRTEGTYTDHRHPDQVQFTRSLAEDLSRRDFTVNAMAWGKGGLTDLFGGQADLEARLLRAVGQAERRFQEDALRMLRALRFSAQLGFSLHPDTAAALQRQLPALDQVSQERVCAELFQLLCAPSGGRVLLEWPRAAVQILPELGPAVGFDQRSPYHRFDVYTHCVKTMELVPNRPELRLAALLHDVGKPSAFTQDSQGTGHFPDHARLGADLAREACLRLRLSNSQREWVTTLVARHGMALPAEERVVRRWLSRLGPELFFDLLALDRADSLARGLPADAGAEAHFLRMDRLAREILARADCLSLRDLAVDGRDALAAGLRGPAIGQALNLLLEEVVEGRLPNRREVLLSALGSDRPL